MTKKNKTDARERVATFFPLFLRENPFLIFRKIGFFQKRDNVKPTP